AACSSPSTDSGATRIWRCTPAAVEPGSPQSSTKTKVLMFRRDCMVIREPVHDHVDHENHAADAYIDPMSTSEKADRLAAVQDWQRQGGRRHRTDAGAAVAEAVCV